MKACLTARQVGGDILFNPSSQQHSAGHHSPAPDLLYKIFPIILCGRSGSMKVGGGVYFINNTH
jgi:hypothetical protein